MNEFDELNEITELSKKIADPLALSALAPVRLTPVAYQF